MILRTSRKARIVFLAVAATLTAGLVTTSMADTSRLSAAQLVSQYHKDTAACVTPAWQKKITTAQKELAAAEAKVRSTQTALNRAQNAANASQNAYSRAVTSKQSTTRQVTAAQRARVSAQQVYQKRAAALRTAQRTNGAGAVWVTSANIRYYPRMTGAKARADIRKVASKSHLIGWQEIGPAYRKYLNTGKNWRWIKASSGKDYPNINSISYRTDKLQLIKHGHVKAQNTIPGVVGERAVVWAAFRVKATNKRVWIVNTHFTPRAHKSASIKRHWNRHMDTLSRVVADMKRRYGNNGIVTGDFNSNKTADKRLVRLGARHHWSPQPTFRKSWIDYMITVGLKVNGARTFPLNSDHHAVTTKVFASGKANVAWHRNRTSAAYRVLKNRRTAEARARSAATAAAQKVPAARTTLTKAESQRTTAKVNHTMATKARNTARTQHTQALAARQAMPIELVTLNIDGSTGEMVDRYALRRVCAAGADIVAAQEVGRTRMGVMLSPFTFPGRQSGVVLGSRKPVKGELSRLSGVWSSGTRTISAKTSSRVSHVDVRMNGRKVRVVNVRIPKGTNAARAPYLKAVNATIAARPAGSRWIVAGDFGVPASQVRLAGGRSFGVGPSGFIVSDRVSVKRHGAEGYGVRAGAQRQSGYRIEVTATR